MKHLDRLVRWGAWLALAAGILGLPARRADASGLESFGMSVDFTKPAEARDLARWSQSDVVRCGERGLGWNGDARRSYEAQIEITEPLAVGHPWWAATNAGIHVTLDWHGPAVDRIYGDVYVRHSPDLESWTDWISVPRDLRDKDRSKHVYRLNLNVPRSTATDWYGLLQSRGLRGKVRAHNELAAWVERHRPGFLARTKPFFGYMQFRFEGSFTGKHYLKTMKLGITHVIPGPTHPNTRGMDEAEARRVRDQRWDYRAPGAPDPALHAAAERTRRAVLSAALAALADEAKGGGAAEDGTKEQLTLCQRSTLARSALEVTLGGTLPDRSPFADIGTDAWVDAKQRADRGRLLPVGLDAGLTIRTTTREGLQYALRGGRAEREDPTRYWQRFHGRHEHSLGLVWATMPGLDAKRTTAIVHVSRAFGPTQGSGRWYLLQKKGDTWRVVKTVVSGAR